MNKKILYIGGGFDILHSDHRKFIDFGIEKFKENYGTLEKVILTLEPDSVLNAKKGIYRPFFSYEWRKEDVSNFLTEKNIEHTVIPTTSCIPQFSGQLDIVAQVSSGNPAGAKELENAGIGVMYIDPINSFHTSTVEEALFELRKKSNCNLRKVGALLLRNGQIISEGYSGSGDCNCCSKYLAYQKGGEELSPKVNCDYPHAEVMALNHAIKGDDILTTDSPCKTCAELIVDKGIRRVVFIQEYYDLKPIEYLRNHGTKVRKAGL